LKHNEEILREKENVIKMSSELDNEINEFKNLKKELENELEQLALENDKQNKKVKIYENEYKEMSEEISDIQNQISS
jgi:uncharacterized coiled-coil DUF342 family protein